MKNVEQMALLYRTILESAGHRAFAAEVEARLGTELAIPPDTGVVLVPGLFYRSHPQAFGNGLFLKRGVHSLAQRLHTIPVDGSDGLDVAAAAINAALSTVFPECRSLLLVSLSKGSAEVRHALAQPEAAESFRRVTAWVSISGLPFGTPAYVICCVIGPERRWRFPRIRSSSRPSAFRHAAGCGARSHR